MLTVYRYTLEEITVLIKKSASNTKEHIMLSAKPDEKITIEWDKDTGGIITYTANEEVSIPFGKRAASFSFAIPEDKLIAHVCIPAILKSHSVLVKDFSKYTYEQVKRSFNKPEKAEDFFLAFTLIKK